MTSNSIQLKSGRSFDRFSYFPNPQSGPEAEKLRELLLSHSLESIDGVVVNLEDLHVVGGKLRLRTPSVGKAKEASGIDESSFLIKPDFSSLFGVRTNRSPETLLNLEVFPSVLQSRYEEAEDESDPTEKRHMKMFGLYPILSSSTLLENIFELQIDHGADILIPPLAPLNTKTDFQSQLAGIESIFNEAHDVANGGYLSKDRDLMYTLAIDPRVLDTPRQERENRIVAAFSGRRPDMLGISLTNLSLESRQANESLLRLIQKLKKQTDLPVVVFNVQEFGLLTFAYGSDAISTPIGKSPYFRMAQGRPPEEGNYYHKEDMEYYSKPDLMSKLRRNNYRLPCDCSACDGQPPIHQIAPTSWNDNRKRHFIFTRESEVRQLEETKTPIDKALLDKFGRSERSEFIKYLD